MVVIRVFDASIVCLFDPLFDVSFLKSSFFTQFFFIKSIPNHFRQKAP